nr:cation transporter [bacterium]
MIIFSSIKKIIFGTELNSIDESIIVMLISILITGIIVFFLNRTAKKTNNLIIKADLIHYTMDFLTNT